MPHGKDTPQRGARENVDMAAAGKPKSKGYRDDMDVGKTRGVFARGRGPGRASGKRHR